MIFGWGQRKQREILNQTPATLDDGEKKNGSLMTGIEKSFCETFFPVFHNPLPVKFARRRPQCQIVKLKSSVPNAFSGYLV